MLDSSTCSRRRCCAAALMSLLVLTSAGMARAADTDDTVLLANGGRLRGVVIADDPDQGVTIKLADGTTRTVQRAQVKSVQYGQPSAGTGAPAGLQLVPAAVVTLAPAAPAPAPGPAAGPAPAAGGERTHRRIGLLVTGISLAGLGVLALPVGGGMLAAAHHAKTCGLDPCSDERLEATGAGMMITGGVFIAAGTPLFIVGMIKVPDESPKLGLTSVGRPLVTLAVAPSLGRDTAGVHFVG